METLTDWYRLWIELSELQSNAFARKKEHRGDDFWKHKARQYDKMVDERWARPDSSRNFLVRKLKDNPGSTLLDIGAGTGKWSVLVSPYCSRVSALEPSAAMQQILKEKLEQENINNIDIVTATWPGDGFLSHDYVLASHSMYGVKDFKAFVNKMNQTAQKACIMVLRVPFADSVMAAASKKVLGQPYDSPNFQVAYNCLLGMDIYPDVIMEQDGSWTAWANDSFEEALDEMKNRLGLTGPSGYDQFLADLLKKHLIVRDQKYVWPAGNRSALVYWEV